MSHETDKTICSKFQYEVISKRLIYRRKYSFGSARLNKYDALITFIAY